MKQEYWKYIALVCIVLLIVGSNYYFVMPRYNRYIENRIANNQRNSLVITWVDRNNETTYLTLDNLCKDYVRALQQKGG